MGRHPKDDLSVRSEGIRIRLTTAEHAWIKTMAKKKNCTSCEVLREAFRESIRKMDPDEFAEASVEVTEEMKRQEKRKKQS